MPAWGLHLLAFAVAWTVLLSTLVPVVDPAAASMLANHSHTSLTGLVPQHTHATNPDAEADAHPCVATRDSGATVVCGADETVGIGAMLLSTAAVGALGASGLLATPLEAPARILGVAERLLTPPPRG